MPYLPSVKSGRNNLRNTMLLAGVTLAGSTSFVLPASAQAWAQNGAAFKGSVRSGLKPITESTVVLIAAGSKGYGAGAQLLDVTLSDPKGNFSFPYPYQCPASPNDQLYVVAAGGDAGSGYNNNTALMATLGTCSALTTSTFVTINEVSTIASAYALSSFSTVAAEVGTSSTNYQGLVNAFQKVGNLVNPATGAALTITPAYAGDPTPYLNSSTVPQARIDTLANILAGCVESNGTSGSSTACASLFAAAPGRFKPSNTLQAALNIAHSPAANVAALYALASTATPYTPALSVTPTDLQLAITYTGGGLGLAPGLGVGDIQNTALGIDATGNVYVTAYGDQGGDLVPRSSMIAKFSPIGAPLTPATTQPTPMTVTYGGYPTTPLGIADPIDLAIDEFSKVWITSGDTDNINAVSTNLSPALSGPVNTEQLGPVTFFAIDGKGDVWTAGHPGEAALGEFSNSGVLLSPQSGYTGGGAYGTDYYGTLIQPTFDSTGKNIWSSDNDFGDFYRTSASTGQLVYDYFPSGGQVTALVAGRSGNVYACPSGPDSLLVFNASSDSPVATYPIPSGRGCGNRMTVDGDGNIFVTSSVLDEYSSTGAVLSPAKGFTATSAEEAPTYPAAISSAVDASGSLWLLNVSTGNYSTNPHNVLVEVIGAAAPTVTPRALALKEGKIGERP